jgi:hypothetical protein
MTFIFKQFIIAFYNCEFVNRIKNPTDQAI